MSKLDELIKELCPNGVEYKSLDDVACFRRGSFPQPYTNQSFYGGENAMPFVQVADMLDDIFALKEETKQTISEIAQPKSVYVKKGTVLVSIQGTIGRVAITHYDAYVDRTIAIFNPLKININKKFFAYVLKQKFDYEKKFARGSTLKTITKDEFSKFMIPVPPIEVQNEIVRILDNFTELTTELTAKLSEEQIARKKQYEYYRKLVFTLETNVPLVSLGTVCDIVTGGEAPDDCIKGDVPDELHPYAVWGNGKDVYGYSGSYKIDKDSVVISSIGANTGAVYFKKAYFTPIIRLKVVTPKDETLDIRYLFHALSATEIKSKSSSVPNMNANEIKKIQIPIPSINTQKHIADILDRFDVIYCDIVDCLPAEVEATKKQYAYYRDRLLNFKELR